MDARLAEAKGNQADAFARLSSFEQQLVDREIALATAKTPNGRRYFLENYFIINTKGEDEGGQLLQSVSPFTDTQEILWDEFVINWNAKLPLFLLLLKARQIRWSTLVQGVIFQDTITTPNTNSLIIADEFKRSNQIYKMSDLAYTKLPWFMRPEKATDNKGDGIVQFDRKDKEERLTNPGLNSHFFIDAANKPSGSSRGFTLHNVHATEFGLWTHAKILTSDILPAVPKKNPNVTCIAEGTAKGAGEKNAFLKMWKLAMEGKGRFRPVFAAWWKEKTYSKPFPSQSEYDMFFLTKEEEELVEKVRDEFGYQITKEQMAWRRQEAEQVEATEGDAEMIEQEYPSFPRSAFRSGGLAYFPLKNLARMEVSDVRLPIWAGDLIHKRDDKGNDKPVLIRYFARNPRSTDTVTAHDRTRLTQSPLWIWEWPNSKDLYYEASDPSKGIVGLDFSAAQVFRVPRKNGERIRQVLEYRGYADPKDLSKIVCTIGHMYNTCEMAPECNNMTEHIGNVLHVHKYPKLYRWRRRDKIHNSFTWFYGWDTGSHKSREDLLVRFKSLVKEFSIEIRSSRLLSEMQSFVQMEDSERFEAAAGEHDDALFAAMICCYCLLEMDPALFQKIETDQLPDPKVGKHNTDFSLFDDADQSAQVQFNML